MKKNLDAHVGGGEVADSPWKCAGRLGRNDCVDDGVYDSADGSSSDEIDGEECLRGCQHVEECDGNESQNVLQIVSMSPTNTLHILVAEFRLQVLECLCVLWVGKRLKVR